MAADREPPLANPREPASVEDAQAQLSRRVIGLHGVAGTAVGLHAGKPCVKVYLETDDPALRKRVPRSVGDWPVVVEVTGTFRRQ